MFKKKLRQMGAMFLTFSMVLGSAGISEMGAKAADTTLTSFASSLTAPTITAGADSFAMPTGLPSGAEIRFCADYEQVIGEDGTIYAPLETKTVKGFYEVSKDGESAKSSEFTLEIPGIYTDSAQANAKPDVVPELQEWHGAEGGDFIASAASRIIVGSSELQSVADTFAENYKEITGVDIDVISGTQADVKMGDFYLTLGSSDEGLGEEGYRMNIDDSVVIEAKEATGVHWGTISALQILKQTNGSIPKGLVRDYPKYEVRAFHLDVGRKPFTLDVVYEFAKNMSWYKMNSFQVHLSDNLIFMEDYKTIAGGDEEEGLKLALEQTYSGHRLESSVINEETGEGLTSEDIYYTKDEFRQFIKDSRAMGVDIVPEFDMPAHALAFTRVFPQYMSSSKTGGNHAYTIDELNLDADTIDETIAWAQRIWSDYFEGDDPVFDEETTIHIGTDEYHGSGGNEGFRKFSDEMIKFVQGTGRNVRMWGSLSNKGGVNGTPKVTSENVQLNLWDASYANPQDMYNAGFDLINTFWSNYIVPGNTAPEGGYGDYINPSRIYNSWMPNNINGYEIKAGDDQILGGCYAVWHDNIDTRANGNSQYDSFKRFFQPLSAYSAKLWGEASRSYDEFAETVEKTGTAPGTKINAGVDSIGKDIVNYSFEESIAKDSSGNGYDLTGTKNAELAVTSEGRALQLTGGESYAETPLDMIGTDGSITMKVKMDEDASGEQILCESKDAFGTYGTYAIKAVQKNTGKVGFSREGYDYSFNYTLPKGEWVELTFQGGDDKAQLYVNGELVDSNPDMYYFNHPDTEMTAALPSSIKKVVTMLLPVGRIGSTTNSFKGQIEYLTVEEDLEVQTESGQIPQEQMEASACSEIEENGNEGPARFMLDNNPDTFWHTDWRQDLELSNEEHHKVTLTFKDGNPRTVSKLTYLPRQDRENGRILKYRISVEKADGSTETVAQGEWADNAERKTAVFSQPVEAVKVILKIDDSKGDSVGVHATIAELNLYEPAEAFGSSELQAEVDKYKDLTEDEYTDISWRAFINAYERALAVINKEGSTEAEYINACENLQKAAANLTEKPTANKLSDEIKEAEKKDMSGYSSDIAVAYAGAVSKAESVLSKENATQKEMENALAVLQTAGKAVDAVADAEKQLADVSSYTTESIEALKKAISDTIAAIGNAEATQELIEAAVENMQAVKLVKKNSEGTSSGNQEPQPKPQPQVPAPQVPELPAKNFTFTSKDGVLEFKVTKSAKENGTVAVSKLKKKAAKKVKIPATVTINGYTFKVTSIAAKAFQKSSKLTSVEIGANVKSIGANAFFNSKKLKSVVFKGKTVPKLSGKKVFKGTAAKCKVTAPKKMSKKQFKSLKTKLKKAGMSKKAVYKQK